jgi:hypothetical protein
MQDLGEGSKWNRDMQRRAEEQAFKEKAFTSSTLSQQSREHEIARNKFAGRLVAYAKQGRTPQVLVGTRTRVGIR